MQSIVDRARNEALPAFGIDGPVDHSGDAARCRCLRARDRNLLPATTYSAEGRKSLSETGRPMKREQPFDAVDAMLLCLPIREGMQPLHEPLNGSFRIFDIDLETGGLQREHPR